MYIFIFVDSSIGKQYEAPSRLWGLEWSPQYQYGYCWMLVHSRRIFRILKIRWCRSWKHNFEPAKRRSVSIFVSLKSPRLTSDSVLTIYCCYRLAESVRLMMALSIFLSYALQFYVPIDIVWPNIKCHIPTERMQVFWEYVFRTVLVIITCKTSVLI